MKNQGFGVRLFLLYHIITSAIQTSIHILSLFLCTIFKKRPNQRNMFIVLRLISKLLSDTIKSKKQLLGIRNFPETRNDCSFLFFCSVPNIIVCFEIAFFILLYQNQLSRFLQCCKTEQWYLIPFHIFLQIKRTRTYTILVPF